MPHATVSTRDEQGRRTCPYCGYPLRPGQLVCRAHDDLPAREYLDDRYTITEDTHRV
jgi:hypothetical protein